MVIMKIILANKAVLSISESYAKCISRALTHTFPLLWRNMVYCVEVLADVFKLLTKGVGPLSHIRLKNLDPPRIWR